MSKSNFKKGQVNLDRDYNADARDLIKGLKRSELHQLYEIVIDKYKIANNDNRRAELKAVQRAIEGVAVEKNLDEFRMKKAITGYGSEMARTANAKHGNARKSSKKA
jgi:hypothetical protein